MLKNKFLRNILTMMKGTTVAQLTPIILSPILTRMYSPAEFGVFAIYLAILSILTPIINSRYELAISLPESEKKSYTIFILTMIINIFVTFIIVVTLIISKDLFGLIQISDSNTNLIFVIPISIALIGIMNPLIYIANREREFKRLANAKIGQSLGGGISQVFFGWMKFGVLGMILGNIIGIIISILNLYKKNIFNKKIKEACIKVKDIKEVAIEYKEFPRYAMITHTLETSTSNLPQFFLQKVYGSSITGYYSLSMRTVSLPIGVIGKSIGDVFLSEASKQFREFGNCIKLYKKTFCMLAAISVLPFLILYIVAPSLFAIVFGEEWIFAGEMTQILVPALYLNFIANPLSHMFIVAKKVRVEFYFQIFILLITVCVFFYAYLSNLTVLQSMFFYSIVLMLKNIISIVLTYRFSKGKVEISNENK